MKTSIICITLLLVIVDSITHTISLCNAGHVQPILRAADGDVKEIRTEKGGLPLGVLEKQEYGIDEIQLQPGDALLLYTDGISDATNAANEQYEIERLTHPLSVAPSHDVAGLGVAILQDVEVFTGTRQQFDDSCLVLIRRDSDV